MAVIGLLGLLLCIGFAMADITGTWPSNGACLCADGNGVNVRGSACGSSVLGSISRGQCYTYLGSQQQCSLGGAGYTFYKIRYGQRDGWVAGRYLKNGSPSDCGGGSGRSGLTDRCLSCICQIESECNSNIGCAWDVNSDSCGPYQIKEDYWNDCGRPGSSWRSCANDKACSERCFRSYMARYGTRCTGGRALTCQDYARIHNGGPNGCKWSATLGYWNKIRACCGGDNGCD